MMLDSLHFSRRAACVAAWLLVSAPGMTQAATVGQARGEVRIERAGKSLALLKGRRLAEGDTLTTGKDAEVFVRMDDGGALAVRENSRVSFEMVRLRARGKGAVPAGERGQVLKLTVGALRYLTGSVGKARPDAIRFATPTATIGIRGTDIDVVVREVADVEVMPGTYVQVNSGGAVLQSLAASASAEPQGLSLGENEAGFVGEPLVARGARGRVSASLRKLAPSGEVFKRSGIDRLFR